MKVYKYRGIESDCLERDINTFSNNQFFAPKFENLNDPFEANFEEIISEVLRKINKKFSNNANQVIDRLNNVIEFKNKLGIYSLSKNVFSEQMWAYYASSHRGYCVEYDLNFLIDKVYNFDFSKLIEVKYTNKKTMLEISDINQKEIILTKMFGTKKDNWKQEEEIRLLFECSSIKNHHPYAIKAIYFGHLATENLKKDIIECFGNKHIIFYDIIISKEKNMLDKKLINIDVFNQKYFEKKSLKREYQVINSTNCKSKKIYKTSDNEEYWAFLEDEIIIEKRYNLFYVIKIRENYYALNGSAKNEYNLDNPHDAGITIQGKSLHYFIKLTEEL